MSRPLSPDERQHLETLFDRAADLPPVERAAFVERECGEHQPLRDELERLLAGLAGDDILGRLEVPATTRAGSTVGPYKLLEKVGEGGMGEVYSAEQSTPVVRRVALKIVKLGMDSAQVVGRFEAERQALALMSHPNVAQVFDGGTTDDGRPYFVMEFVAGEPLGEFCNRRMLSTRARIELFLDLCSGVQHAHQKGIIHRDLKPSNLLVTPQDGRPVPKIIDFGVARSTGGRLGERSLHTLMGQIVGTLDYMSPEQADPTGLDIDTRSDVYSLGVVLYELVSGLLPFGPQSIGDLPFTEVLHEIRHKDPPTPSTRLRRETDTAAATARLRGTDEISLIRQLSGDLDWICIKALEKDPARRYQSPSELADDLRRHLEHQPVHAGRPGALYRARKFVRRNRLGVAAGLLIALAIVGGIFGIVSGRIDARASARVADALRPQADVYQLSMLMREADRLWPAYPHMLPAFDGWLASAEGLVERLPALSAERDELRSRAEPWTNEERKRDWDESPLSETLAGKQAEFDQWVRELELGGLEGGTLVEAEERVLVLEAELPALEEEVARRRTWSFESAEDGSRHYVLNDLVDQLEELREELLYTDATSAAHGWSIPKRRRSALELERSFAPGGEHALAWEAALPQIAAAYPGLDLSPQMGLYPLGADPDSGLWEFAHLQSGPRAERGRDEELILAPDSGLVLVLLREATFWMGAQAEDSEGQNYDSLSHPAMREGPPLEVDVPAFFLSKFEMTQAQWELSCRTNPSLVQRGMVQQAPMNPINQVNWYECATTLQWLELRLPSEAEWEYAARAGTTTPWYAGVEAADARAAGNVVGRADGFLVIAPVGSFPANDFGLHDMIGNASEWVADHPYNYGTIPGSSPEALRMRTTRGGSSRLAPLIARSAARRPIRTGADDPALGVRPARGIDP